MSCSRDPFIQPSTSIVIVFPSRTSNRTRFPSRSWLLSLSVVPSSFNNVNRFWSRTMYLSSSSAYLDRPVNPTLWVHLHPPLHLHWTSVHSSSVRSSDSASSNSRQIYCDASTLNWSLSNHSPVSLLRWSRQHPWQAGASASWGMEFFKSHKPIIMSPSYKWLRTQEYIIWMEWQNADAHDQSWRSPFLDTSPCADVTLRYYNEVCLDTMTHVVTFQSVVATNDIRRQPSLPRAVS